ncbi:MAG: B12-binding domain-containing radical SAM protein [Planctomycetes bacterium]|nr:B12-binding domain-containing radical SAM protein [Planctomycetota bacterium]
MRVLLVHPRSPDTFWSFKHSLPFVAKRAAFAPLGLLTVAALLPREWELELVDLDVEELPDEAILAADYVFLGAMIVHRASVEDVVARCRALGRPVVAGGPLFTTGHEDFTDVEHFVLGEAESVVHELVADLLRGTPRRVYRGASFPQLHDTPVPRWDLVDLRRYVTMSVQFSRGCPYDCEFCDIVVMNGRVPRTKAPAQLVAELDALRRRGWKEMVFVVDDNFIGDKKRTKELLRAIIAWRERVRPSMGFFTEASVNLADDPELCELMTRAGFKKVFVGIETPSNASLRECHKLQNEGRDLVGSVRTIQRAGMEVMGGFIVGFDSDGPDIFHRQFEFIQRSGVVTAMVGLLTALPQTRLYRRLDREGRLRTASTGNNTQAVLNFEPRLAREFLQGGYRELMQRLYEPKAYYERVRTFLKHHRPSGPTPRLSSTDVRAFVRSIWLLGARHRGRFGYWRLFASTLLRRPRQFPRAIEFAIVGHHFRRVASAL